MNGESAPSYAEFRQAVKASMWEEWPQLDEEEVERYLGTGEALKVIRQKYDAAVRDLESGKTTRNVVMHGYVSSAGLCLSLMYEPER